MSLLLRCRHRITIEQNLGLADGRGGAPENWQPQYTNVRARFIPAGEKSVDKFRGGAVQSHAQLILPDATLAVTTQHRALIDGAPYRILSVTDPHGRGKFLMLEVERWA